MGDLEGEDGLGGEGGESSLEVGGCALAGEFFAEAADEFHGSSGAGERELRVLGGEVLEFIKQAGGDGLRGDGPVAGKCGDLLKELGVIKGDGAAE